MRKNIKKYKNGLKDYQASAKMKRELKRIEDELAHQKYSSPAYISIREMDDYLVEI